MEIKLDGPVETNIPIKAPHREAIHYENPKYYKYLFGYRFSAFITDEKFIETVK